MAFKEIQEQVDEWIQQYKIGYYPPLAILTQLTEELGELAREINNQHGPRVKKSPEDGAEISEEISDLFFCLVSLANSQGIDLDEAWKKKMEKSYGRDADRWEKK